MPACAGPTTRGWTARGPTSARSRSSSGPVARRRRRCRWPPAARRATREALFLGVDGATGAPVWAIERDGVPLTGLRDLAASLPADQLGTIAYASALANWARATRFCGVCGLETAPREAGHVRACANGHQHHPRTDPVVIMLVTDGDRALLGRQASWPAGRYSRAGGVRRARGGPGDRRRARGASRSPGSSCATCAYVASQPWPFPVSLMLGFHAALRVRRDHEGRRGARGRRLVHPRRDRRGRLRRLHLDRRRPVRRPHAAAADGDRPSSDRCLGSARARCPSSCPRRSSRGCC